MKSTYQIGQSFIAVLLSVTLLVTSSGCASSTAHFSRIEEIRRQTRTVVVVPANSVVRIYFEPAFAMGKASGAAKGAGIGALEGFFACGKAGVALIVLWPIIPIFTIAGAAAGAESGAKRAVPVEDIETAHGLICEDSSNIQERFAQHLLTAGSKITSYRFQIVGEAEKGGLRTGSSADLTAETEISSIGFVGGEGRNPLISLSIVATVRAITLSDGAEVYRGQKRYLSTTKLLSMWSENKAALLKQEVDAALTSIAEQLAEELFLVHDFYAGERRCFATAGLEDARLLLEVFPNEQDRKSDPQGTGMVSEVSYDVMVWPAVPLGTVRPDPEVIYEYSKFTVHHIKASREQLMQVTARENSMNSKGEVIDSQTIVKNVLVAEPDKDIQLAMNTDYECSTRTRYKLENETRMTSWSHYSAFTTPRAPVSAYSEPGQVIGRTFYTQINIWYEKPDKIYSTNYHQGTLLPIATKVKITEIGDANPLHRYVRFSDEAGRSYTVVFQMRHAREGLTMWHLFDHYFGTNDPLADGSTFKALSTLEQENIIAGKVVSGMSKSAVLMAYGYPPSHKTPSLAQNSWIYWLDGRQTRIISFKDNRVVNDNPRVQ